MSCPVLQAAGYRRSAARGEQLSLTSKPSLSSFEDRRHRHAVRSREAAPQSSPPHPLLLWQGEGGAPTARPTAETPSASPAPLAAPATPPVPLSRACAHAPGTSGRRVLGGSQPGAPLPGRCRPSVALCWLFWGSGFCCLPQLAEILSLYVAVSVLRVLTGSLGSRLPKCLVRPRQTSMSVQKPSVTVQWKAGVHFFTQSLAVEFWLLGLLCPWVCHGRYF